MFSVNIPCLNQKWRLVKLLAAIVPDELTVQTKNVGSPESPGPVHELQGTQIQAEPSFCPHPEVGAMCMSVSIGAYF